MSTDARRRLLKDFDRVSKETSQEVFAAPNENNIMECQAVIYGPYDTVWEGGTFRQQIDFTEEYPRKAPKVKFLTKMYHPNVYHDGSICMDIQQKEWTPMMDLQKILICIRSLLCDPNPASPANASAAKMFVDNFDEYLRLVRLCVEDSWNFVAVCGEGDFDKIDEEQL